MIPENLGSLLRSSARSYPKKTALYFKMGQQYSGISYSEFSSRVDAVASSLLKIGVLPGDRVAILSENRPEWALIDLAALSVGALTVPIYTSLTSAEIRYILADCGAVVLTVSGKALFDKISPIQRSLPNLKAIIGFDAALSLGRDQVGVPIHLMKEIEAGELNPELSKYYEAVTSSSDASIIYTSGTTGEPKGVVLTHANFIHNIMGSRESLKMSSTDTHLSFLPLCHVFERMAGHYLMIYIGATIAYAESMDTVSQNLLETKPTFVLGVPRFYEKILGRVLEAVKVGGPVKKALFYWAKDLGEAKRLGSPRSKSFLFPLKFGVADRLVYKKFKARLGGRVRFCVSGGAPLKKEIAEFFSDLGVMIYEGYGLTETSPVISVNRVEKYRFGSVGVPLEGVSVRIAEDGEIQTKSSSVMKGYWNKPAETSAALVGGWFLTGDLGHLDKDGFLLITGRKKELIVTSGGKKISPRPVEEQIEQDPFILRCVLFGEGQRFLTAVIVPREEQLMEYAAAEKIAYRDYHELVQDAKIRQFIERRIEEASVNLANYEKIKYFVLAAQDFSQAAGELTPTLKVKREAVYSRYKENLLKYYERAG